MSTEVQHIVNLFNRTDHDTSKDRVAIEKILDLLCKGHDVSTLTNHVLQLLPKHDLLVKRYACFLITRFIIKNPDLGLNVSNTLQKDFRDHNPLVRALALQTVCAIPSLAQVSEHLIPEGLHDGSVYVRRTAVTSCSRIFQHVTSNSLDHRLVDELYSMLRDPDPLVVSNSLTAIEEILETEGGVVINKNIAHYLMDHGSLFTEWNLVHVLHLISKYSPRNEEEAVNTLQFLDPYTNHCNAAVVVSASQLLFTIASSYPKLRPKNTHQLQANLCAFMASDNPEMTSIMLAYIKQLRYQDSSLFSENYRSFFCRYTESIANKEEKIEILSVIIDNTNVDPILEELKVYCLNSSPRIAKKAIKAVGTAAKLHSPVRHQCIEKLTSLLEIEEEPILSQVLMALQEIQPSPEELNLDLLVQLSMNTETIKSTDGRSALIWMLGQNVVHIRNPPQILEQIVDGWWTEDSNFLVKQIILITAIKIFFFYPAEMQILLGSVLEKCFASKNVFLQDRAKFYYQILHRDVNIAKTIVHGKKLNAV